MRTAPLLPLVLCLTLDACELDFTEPARGAPTRFAVTLTSTDGAGGTIRLGASLVPGSDGDGVTRRVVDEAMEVAGDRRMPSEVDRDGTRSYLWESEFASGGEEPVVVGILAPEIEGLEGRSPSMVAHVPHRVGPAVLRVVRGEPIRLGLTDSGMAADGGRASWQLAVQRSDDRALLFRASSGGVPPGTLTIPGEWIPADAGSELLVTVTVDSQREGVWAGGEYTAELDISTTSFWRVRLR